MSSSLLEMVNKALATLGQQPLVSLSSTNTTPTAIIVKNSINIVTEALLTEADWNCARKTAKLAKLSNQKNIGWKNAFAIPTEPPCLQIVQISLDNGDTFIDINDYYNHNAGPKESLFDLDENRLLSNSESVVIKYTALVDHSKFDAALADAFSARLAAELCYAITASTSNAEYLQKIAERKLRKAKSRNALNRNIVRPEGEVIGVRGGESSYIRFDMGDEAE